MADALRHARLLHYALIALSLLAVVVLAQRNPLAETCAAARLELQVLQAVVGQAAEEPERRELPGDRMERARSLIASRVQEHVYSVLSRSLQLGMGGDFDEITMTWEVPIAHQGKLPLDSDLLEIRSHFAAIPILVLQPDLAELSWLLTSGMSATAVGEIRELHIRVKNVAPLEDHVRRFGFSPGEESVTVEIECDYGDGRGSLQRIKSTVRAQAVRMPDLNQRAAFHASFPELERVFHLVEYQTPEQAEITLAEREREARGGLFERLSQTEAARMTTLLAVALLLLLILSHVRHLIELLPDSDLRPLRYFAWFPLFPDPNSRSFSVLTFMLLPASGALARIARQYFERSPVALEDLLLYGVGFAVPLWIGSTILSELDTLREAAAEAIGDPALDPPVQNP